MNVDLHRLTKIEMIIAAQAIGVKAADLKPLLSNECLGSEIMKAQVEAFRKGVKLGNRQAKKTLSEEV